MARRSPGAAVAAILVVGLVSCTATRHPSVVRPAFAHGEAGFVAARAGVVYRAASWNPSLHRLLVVGETHNGERVLLVDRFGRARFLGVPHRRGCSGMQQTDAASLPDGRIVTIDKCLGPLAIRAPDASVTIDVYDGRSRTFSRYRRYYLFIWRGAIAFSSRAGAPGLYAKTDGLAGELEKLGPRRLVPIRLPVSNVSAPSWARDGTRFAVDGVPLSAGPDTPTRRDTPWRLYVVDRAMRRVRVLAPVLDRNAPSTWSPTGAWIAFRGAPRGEPVGIWAVGVNSGKTVFLLRGSSLGAPVWLPDGRLVVPTSASRSGLLVVGRRSLRRAGLQ